MTPGRRATAGKASLRLRRRFAIVQVGTAFVLLAVASALGLGLASARRSDAGFEPEHTLIAALNLPASRYSRGDEQVAFARRAVDALKLMPGVETAAVSTNVPVRGRGSINDRQAIHVVGHVPTPGRSPLLHNRYGVVGDYLGAMGVRLLDGRFLDARDNAAGVRSVVVDEDFARFYWPDGKALGQRLFNGPNAGDDDEAFVVVGVVAAVRQEELHAGGGNGTLYLPYRHLPGERLFATLRTRSEPRSMTEPLRAALIDLDPSLALDDIRPMQARIDETLIVYRTPAVLATLFAWASGALAAVGCFGLLGFIVNHSRSEIAIRMALGATRGRIARSYLGFGLRVGVFGCLVGATACAVLWASLADHLPGAPLAPRSGVLASAGALVLIALLASLLPAARAARTAPSVTLMES